MAIYNLPIPLASNFNSGFVILNAVKNLYKFLVNRNDS